MWWVQSVVATAAASVSAGERKPNVFLGRCPACGGAVRIIACIEDPEVIEKILTHPDAKASGPEAARRPRCRAPPQRGLFEVTG